MHSDYSFDLNTRGRASTPKESNACANALRALQERVKQLEIENAEMKDRLIVFDSRGNYDREKWQLRLMEEVQLSKDKQAISETKISELEKEKLLLQKQISVLRSKSLIPEPHHKVSLSSENLLSKYSVEIEGMTKEIDQLKRILKEKNSSERTENEKKLLENELRQEKKLVKSLEAELRLYKNTSGQVKTYLEQNLTSLESEHKAQNSDLISKLKESRLKNKTLRELNSNQLRQIEYLKKELSELTRFKGKENFKTNVQQKRRSVSPKSKKFVFKQEKSALVPACSEESLKQMISENEKSLEMLNQRYKSLLNMSKDCKDLVTVRHSLTSVAEEIDKRSEGLFELKIKQQELLRAKLYS